MRSPNIAKAIADYTRDDHEGRLDHPLSVRVEVDPASREGRLIDLVGFLITDHGLSGGWLSYARGALHGILKNPRLSQRRAKA